MTEQEIEEGNELIAKWMGWWLKPGSFGMWYKPQECDLPIGNGLFPHEFRFHSSWDWLMPVVQRIADKSSNPDAHKYWNQSSVSDIRIFREGKHDTFKEVVKFIKWDNTRKQVSNALKS